MKKIIIRGTFVETFLRAAADGLGIELVASPGHLPVEEEVAFINSFPAEDVLCYLFFAEWGDKLIYSHLPQIKHKKVFWNLEDPNHFPRFIYSIGAADLIFTSASERLSSYNAVYPNIPAFPLTWAAEPTMHYPNMDDLEFKNREFDIVFVGNRYPNVHERMLGETAVLLPALEWAKENDKKFGVFGIGDDSMHSWKFVQQVWNSGVYQEHTSAYDAGEIYRRSTVVLCMNEQIHSPTMTSMRTYEACACANIVLSHYSEATQNIFGDTVLMSSTPADTKAILDGIFEGEDAPGLQYQVLAQRACAHVLEHHTYAARLLELTNKLFDAFGV